MIDDLKVETKGLSSMVKKLKKNNIKEVSFEFLIASCFPNALKNIKEEMRMQYTQGYAAGLQESGEKSQKKEKK